ncbi:hypothetical protein [Streptomyces wuyuanensis]|uniref:hypothetical protein n=1 Tax=Streptomyces wuyuanensis TaxID=1196353 RepID=UPI00342C020E
MPNCTVFSPAIWHVIESHDGQSGDDEDALSDPPRTLASAAAPDRSGEEGTMRRDPNWDYDDSGWGVTA